jgi:dTDP-4-dehydrorhamnose 3,5-epimerase-like enzyme/dTDP-4-dehydrorhamnose reductase
VRFDKISPILIAMKEFVFSDKRGSLHSIKRMEYYTKEVLISHSFRGVLRGLHCSPYSKKIYVMEGELYDFWYVPDGGEYFEGVLKQGESMVIPPNALHGFYAQTEVRMIYFLQENFQSDLDKNYHWLSPGLPFKYDFSKKDINISDKDLESPFFHQFDYLLLGSSGYLGSFTEKVLKDQKKKYFCSNERLSNVNEIFTLIKRSGVKYVICAAGISGRPTTQWCEEHEKETYQVNYLQMLNLMELTESLKVHLTIYGTGLLYDTTNEKAIYVEQDPPNLANSVYVRLRVELESKLRLYSNTLCLRVLFPCTGDGHEKCFLTKMKGRTSSVHNISVAMTVVPDLFPFIPKIIEAGTIGPLNFVNSGTVFLPELLSIFNVTHVVTNSEAKQGVELSTSRLSQIIGQPTLTVQGALKNLLK